MEAVAVLDRRARDARRGRSGARTRGCPARSRWPRWSASAPVRARRGCAFGPGARSARPRSRSPPRRPPGRRDRAPSSARRWRRGRRARGLRTARGRRSARPRRSRRRRAGRPRAGRRPHPRPGSRRGAAGPRSRAAPGRAGEEAGRSRPAGWTLSATSAPPRSVNTAARPKPALSHSARVATQKRDWTEVAPLSCPRARPTPSRAESADSPRTIIAAPAPPWRRSVSRRDPASRGTRTQPRWPLRSRTSRAARRRPAQASVTRAYGGRRASTTRPAAGRAQARPRRPPTQGVRSLGDSVVGAADCAFTGPPVGGSGTLSDRWTRPATCVRAVPCAAWCAQQPGGPG